MKKYGYWAGLLIIVFSAAAWAEPPPMLSVRTVTASETPVKEDPRLKDVLPLLKTTLRFSGFVLNGETTMPMSEGRKAMLPNGYVLTLSQVEGNKATVDVTQKRKRLLQTRLTLRRKRPVVVGGFDSPDGGKTIIILKLVGRKSTP